MRAPAWDHSGFANPAGRIVRTADGPAFVPGPLPPDIDYGEIRGPLTEAERGVAELKGVGGRMADPGAAVALLQKREAAASSRIEGIDATLRDVCLHGARARPGGPAAEAAACAEALAGALGGAGGPSYPGAARAAHRTLMEGRGERPGRFRLRQNWIVRRAAGSLEVLYAPPPPALVPGLLENLAEFARAGPEISALVRCAVAHYQFEAVHPFPDGNGRVGRILIPLMLRRSGRTPVPLLYPSAYFERRRQEYYGGLLGVSRTGRWGRWLAFFLRGLAEQALESVGIIGRLEGLRAEYAEILAGRGARAGAAALAGRLFCDPCTTVPLAARRLGVTYPTAKAAVDELAGAGILEEAGGGRGRAYCAEGIIGALEGGGRGDGA